MEIFLDSVDLNEIENYATLGVIDGVTTNPSLFAKSGFTDVIYGAKEICKIFPNGKISVEVVGTSYEEMLDQAKRLCDQAENILIKLPMTIDGLRLCKYISSQLSRDVNMTLCFSETQAVMAYKAGAKYISLFIGRLEDRGDDWVQIAGNVQNYLNNQRKNEVSREIVANKYLRLMVHNFENLTHKIKSGIEQFGASMLPFKFRSSDNRSGEDDKTSGKAKESLAMQLTDAPKSSSLLVASVRNIDHVIKSISLGADSITMPGKILGAMLEHDLTIVGLKKFDDDWKKSGLGFASKED